MFETRESYRDAWQKAFTTDPGVPLNVDIELASLCNLACPFCFWGEADFNQEMLKHADDAKPKKRLMRTDVAMQLIDEAAAIGVPALKFNWRGESTLHPDYSAILTYARGKTRTIPSGVPETPLRAISAFHDLLVNTNANCKERAIEGLMAATKVMISLDSCMPATYEKMRVNGRLYRALDVAQELIRRGHPDLWIRRVVTKDNQGEAFKAMVDERLGGRGYQVSEHFCVDRSTDSQHVATNNPEAYERTYCGYPSQRMMIASDGTVYPCCVDYDGTMPMGKYTGKPGGTLLDIWHGERFQVLRETLRRNAFASPACRSCTSWMAYRAPQRDNVQDKAL